MVMSVETGRVIASCFAMAAFAVAVLAGLSQGNDAAQILLRAVMAMIVCFPIGAVVGLICDGLIRSHLAAKSGDARSEAPLSATANMSDAAADGTAAEGATSSTVKSRAAA